MARYRNPYHKPHDGSYGPAFYDKRHRLFLPLSLHEVVAQIVSRFAQFLRRLLLGYW